MLHISGPVSVAVFTLPGDKVLYLFGDLHGNKTGLCKSVSKATKRTAKSEAMFITEFIDTLPRPTDFFIESYWVSDKDKHRVPMHEPVDIMTTVFNHYKDVLYSSRGRVPTLRAHYTDVRSMSDLSFFMTIIISIWPFLDYVYTQNKDIENLPEFIDNFKNMKTLVKFINLIVSSDDYVKDIKALIQPGQVCDILTSDSITTTAPGDSKRTVHRIRKQILKLNEKDRRCLLSYHRSKCRVISKDETMLTNARIKMMKKLSYCDSYDKLYVHETLLAYMTHLMDIYTIARMMYYIRTSDSKSIVSYAGATHSGAYMQFFQKYWAKEATVIHQHVESVHAKSKRCVSIPKEIIKWKKDY